MTYYPSDETLKEIEEWEGDYHKLMGFIKPFWKTSKTGYWNYDNKKKYKLGTGGWPGNENIIGALKRNTPFWTMCWWQSTVGGSYVFKVYNTYQRGRR